MPGLSVESLIRGTVSKPDRRDHVTSSRPSYNNSPYSNGARQSSYGDDKLSREKQWLQNSNSIQPADPETNSPPPAYSETAKAPLPTPRSTPRPRSISRSPPAPPLQPINTLPRLQLPVIIPQNPREGGFCRAYTPLLEECNVSEAAFFYFLDDFDRSAQASPWFSAVNIASIGSLNRPHSTAMIVALARKRINTFLDRVNAEFFQPRGLFCLLVTWRPDINKTHEEVNIEEPLLSTSMRTLPFPETAQLVFPFGDPTENMDTRDLPMPNNMYGNNMYGNEPGPTSPAYGRGAGIPRLNGGPGGNSYGGMNGYGNMGGDPYAYGGMGNGMMNQGYGGMGMGGGRMGMGMMPTMGGRTGMGMMPTMGGRTGMGMMPTLGGRTGMGMGGGFGGMGMMAGRGGFGGIGGGLGLIAGLIEDKCSSKYSQPINSGYQGQNGYGPGFNGPQYNNGYMARGPPSTGYGGSDTKAFKKDSIYLMVVNMPSDDEMARFGASY